MDRNTLSHYGWIVVLILILVCLLAMATPFGGFIADGFKATYTGFGQTGENAIKTIFVKNTPDTPEAPLPDPLPDTKARFNDTYEDSDYIYWFNGDYWDVKVKSDRLNKTEYGKILSVIAQKPVERMDSCFEGCKYMLKSPTIPDSITTMYNTYKDCTSLTSAPTIPDGVYQMTQTFYNCTSLTAAPVIPNSVTCMDSTFEGCTSLTAAPAIPSNVTSMLRTFGSCTSLTSAPDMSNANSVTDMNDTFNGCTSLITAPVIPNSVTNMSGTFFNCSALTAAPTIPSNVTDLSYAFLSCRSLTGTITINANPSTYNNCFQDTEKAIILTGNSAKLNELAKTAYGGNITIN